MYLDYYRPGTVPILGLYSVRDARNLPPGALKASQNMVWADEGLLKSALGTTEAMDAAGLAPGTPIGLTREPILWGDYAVSLCAVVPTAASTTVRVYYRKYDTSTDTLDAAWTESTAGSGQWGDTRGTIPAYGSVEFEPVADKDGVVGCVVQFGNRSENVLLVNFSETFAAVPVIRITPPDWGQAAVQEFGFSGWFDVKSGTVKSTFGTNGVGGVHYKEGGTFDVDGDGELNLSSGLGGREMRWFTGTDSVDPTFVPTVGDWGWHQFASAVDLSDGRQIVVLYAADGDGVESYFNCFEWALTRQVESGSATATTANKLVDSAQNFLTTVSIGDVVLNDTLNARASVTAVDSDTTLSLDSDIMQNTNAYVILRRWVFHDPTAATPLNTMRKVGISSVVVGNVVDGTGIVTFQKPQDADLSNVDGLWLEVKDADIPDNSLFALRWLATGGVVRGGSEYMVCFRSSESKTDSPGVVLENAALTEEQAAAQRVKVEGASVTDDFVFPRSPDVYFTVRVPIYAPPSETVNGVTAPSGWADKYSVYRRDPDESQFTHVADVSVAEYSAGWQTVSALFGGTSEWKALAYYEDVAAADDRDLGRFAPTGFNEPIPPGQAMLLADKRLFVGAFTGAGSASTAVLNEVWASESGQPFRFRNLARVEEGLLDPDAGFTVPLGSDRVRAFEDVSSSLVGSSSVFCFTDRSLFRIDGPVGRRISLTGCMAPGSVFERNGRCYYLDSEKSLKVLAGSVQDISLYTVQDALDAIPNDRAEFAAGFIHRNRYVLACADADDDSNYRLLVWSETAPNADGGRGAFEDYGKLPTTKAPQYFMWWNVGGRSLPYFMGSDLKVYELWNGADHAGTAIECSFQFADFMPQRPGNYIEVRAIGAEAARSDLELTHTRTGSDGTESEGKCSLGHPTESVVRKRDSTPDNVGPAKEGSSVSVVTSFSKASGSNRVVIYQLAADLKEREVLSGGFEV